MKKKRMLTKAASMVLALALTVGLAACGTNTQKEESADSSLAKQYVFTGQDLDFEMNADDMSMRGIQKVGDRIYMLVEL